MSQVSGAVTKRKTNHNPKRTENSAWRAKCRNSTKLQNTATNTTWGSYRKMRNAPEKLKTTTPKDQSQGEGKTQYLGGQHNGRRSKQSDAMSKPNSNRRPYMDPATRGGVDGPRGVTSCTQRRTPYLGEQQNGRRRKPRYAMAKSK